MLVIIAFSDISLSQLWGSVGHATALAISNFSGSTPPPPRKIDEFTLIGLFTRFRDADCRIGFQRRSRHRFRIYRRSKTIPESPHRSLYFIFSAHCHGHYSITAAAKACIIDESFCRRFGITPVTVAAIFNSLEYRIFGIEFQFSVFHFAATFHFRRVSYYFRWLLAIYYLPYIEISPAQIIATHAAVPWIAFRVLYTWRLGLLLIVAGQNTVKLLYLFYQPKSRFSHCWLTPFSEHNTKLPVLIADD